MSSHPSTETGSRVLARRLLRQSLIAATVSLLSLGAAQAGRPLATDDAGTAGAGNCQIESWWQRGHDSRSLVVAPACGIGDAVEVNAELERSNSAARHKPIWRWAPSGSIRAGNSAHSRWV